MRHVLLLVAAAGALAGNLAMAADLEIPPKQPQLIFSPWTKFCLKGQSADAKKACFTNKDARLESARPYVAAVLIEREGESKKLLRLTFPLGMRLADRARMSVGRTQSVMGFVVCLQNGCMADYEVDATFVDRMKKTKNLTMEATDMNGKLLSAVLPLGDFAKAHGGPPTEVKVREERVEKLQEELQRRDDRRRPEIMQRDALVHAGALGVAHRFISALQKTKWCDVKRSANSRRPCLRRSP
jgi:invasion protein IalB